MSLPTAFATRFLELRGSVLGMEAPDDDVRVNDVDLPR